MRIILVCLGAILASATCRADPIRFPADQFGKAHLALPQSAGNLETLLNSKSDNFELVGSFSSQHPIRRLARSVGRLDLLVEGGEAGEWISVCTATLVGVSQVVTAAHCFRDDFGRSLKVNKARIRFGFYGGQGEDGRDFAIIMPPSKLVVDDDFAILNVEGSPGSVFGFVSIKKRTPEPGEELFVIHHPLGKPQRVTRRLCRSVNSNHMQGIELRHRCDTLPGSSGAPVFSEIGGEAFVGIHVRGGLDDGPASFNVAKILYLTQGRYPELSIFIGQPAGLMRANSALLPQSTSSHSLYSKAGGGYFRKVGNQWNETASDSDQPFAVFEELESSQSEVFLYDKSRDMYLKIPIKGGFASWSRSNPVNWINLVYVQPKADQSSRGRTDNAAADLYAPVGGRNFDPRIILKGVIEQLSTGSPNPNWYGPVLWQTMSGQTGGSGFYPFLAQSGAVTSLEIVNEEKLSQGTAYVLRSTHASGARYLWRLGFSTVSNRIEYMNVEPDANSPVASAGPPSVSHPSSSQTPSILPLPGNTSLRVPQSPDKSSKCSEFPSLC